MGAKGSKPANHDGTGFLYQEIRGETKENQFANHHGSGSLHQEITREEGDKQPNHRGTEPYQVVRRENKGRTGRRETRLQTMMAPAELDPVEGRQSQTGLEIMLELDPVEGRQRETKGHKFGNHDGTNCFSLNELRTPSAEAVWRIIPYEA